MLRTHFFAGVVIIFFTHLAHGQVRKELLGKVQHHLSAIPKKERNNLDFKKSLHFFSLESYDSTIVYTNRYLQGNDANDKLKDYCLLFRGYSFAKKGLYKEAIKSYDRISTRFSLYPFVISQQGNLALVLGDYEKALYLFKSLDNVKTIERFALHESSIQHNIGICYLHLEQDSEAEHHLMKALEMQLSEKDTALIVGSYMDLANLYYNQYRDAEAIPYFLKAYEMTLLIDNFELKHRSALNMSIVEENRGNFEQAIEYRKEYDRWRDSLNNQQKVWEIAELEKRHLSEQKQREIGLLEKDNKIKETERNAMILGSVVLLFVIALLVYAYRMTAKRNKLIAAQKEALDELNAFKNRLFSIVGHDLRSTVHALRVSTTAIRERVAEGSDEDLKKLAAKQGSIANATYGLLDNLLHWALLQSDQVHFIKERHSVSRLLKQVIVNYEPLLEQKSIGLILDIEKSVKVYADADSVKIVLRNLLDNAIKFSGENGRIEISAKEEDDQCCIRIRDNGEGVSPETLAILMEQSAHVSRSNQKQSSTGLGMQLCKSFIEKNGGNILINSEKGVYFEVLIYLLKSEANG